jgi:Lrp/AsnC family transcriptional regulator for asnA, asnC and gidA
MDQLFAVVNDRLKQVDGVRETESFVYFDIHTHRFNWGVPE